MRHDDLGVSAYNESHGDSEIHTEPRRPGFSRHGKPQDPVSEIVLPDPANQNGGRSRGSTPLSTLPLRTRTARGRPRTPEPDSVAGPQASSPAGRVHSGASVVKRRFAMNRMRNLRLRCAAAVEAFRCDPSDELRINGVHAAKFAKRAFDLGDDLRGPGRYDPNDPTQARLRRVRDWIRMAESDALDSRKS